MDEDRYPEKYRKTSYIKGSNEEVPEPFRIGRIEEIYVRKGIGSKPSLEDVRFKVTKFFRPENTHKGKVAGYQADLYLVYYSEEGECSRGINDLGFEFVMES